MRLTPRPATRATASLALAATIALALATCPGAAGAQATPAKPTAAPRTPAGAKQAARRPAPRRISLQEVTGRWAMRVMLMAGDSTLVTHELIATPERSGWRLLFPNRDPIPATAVAVSGDSIVTVFGPYESVLRSGVPVTTRSVYRLRGGRLHGTTVAQYATHSPDSVLQVRSVGTRVP